MNYKTIVRAGDQIFEGTAERVGSVINEEGIHLRDEGVVGPDCFPEKPIRLTSIEIVDEDGLVAFRRLPKEFPYLMNSNRSIKVIWNFEGGISDILVKEKQS